MLRIDFEFTTLLLTVGQEVRVGVLNCASPVSSITVTLTLSPYSSLLVRGGSLESLFNTLDTL